MKAAAVTTGFATSKIACPCEAGIERTLYPRETPDGRPGIAILICAEKKSMKANVAARISQCILPAPTASAFDGLRMQSQVFYSVCTTSATAMSGSAWWADDPAGRSRSWKASMWGKNAMSTVKGIAGELPGYGKGPGISTGRWKPGAAAIEGRPGIIMSFAGGFVGSGFKVGCRNYRFPMPASTNHALCPTLRGTVADTEVPDGVGAVYEIVINGLDAASVQEAMKIGILAATATGGVTHIGASNFGGKLGPYRFMLEELFR
ncbi:MAG: hypothetical protein MZV63_46130 [Marinilabiliales bacterium]|nr:hypothetical protein [Marinilabiliales bacterium]